MLISSSMQIIFFISFINLFICLPLEGGSFSLVFADSGKVEKLISVDFGEPSNLYLANSGMASIPAFSAPV